MRCNWFMVNQMSREYVVVLVSLVAALAVSVGCESVPRGESGGRINEREVTRSDEQSPKASMADLYEFCDEVAMSLAQELVDLPEVRDAPERVVLELGDIENRTRRTSTGDFEMIQRRLRSQLHGSKLIRGRFRIVEDPHRMDREKMRVSGWEPGDEPAKTDRYDPAGTYMLQGTFYEAVRDRVRRYYFEFSLVNLASREIVFQESYDSARVVQR